FQCLRVHEVGYGQDDRSGAGELARVHALPEDHIRAEALGGGDVGRLHPGWHAELGQCLLRRHPQDEAGPHAHAAHGHDVEGFAGAAPAHRPTFSASSAAASVAGAGSAWSSRGFSKPFRFNTQSQTAATTIRTPVAAHTMTAGSPPVNSEDTPMISQARMYQSGSARVASS